MADARNFAQWDVSLLRRRFAEAINTAERLEAERDALALALRALLHCDVCDGEGILFSEDNQPYPCDCRVNAKRALGEE